MHQAATGLSLQKDQPMAKKILVPTLLGILAVLFGLTWYCSVKAEDYFSVWMERTDQLARPLLTTGIVDYRRRLFTAEATTYVAVRGGERVAFHHLIRHYVWGVSITTTAQPADAEQRRLFGELRAVTKIGPTGAISSRLTLPRLQIDMADDRAVIEQISAEWQSGAAAGQVSWRISAAQGDFLVADQGSVAFSGGELRGTLTDLDPFPLGQHQATIGTLSLRATGMPRVSLETLRLDGDTRRAVGGGYQSGAQVAFAALSIGAETFRQGRMIVETDAIDEPLVDLFVQARRELRRQLQSGGLAAIPVAATVFPELYEQLLQSGLTLFLRELTLATDGGDLLGSGSVMLPPATGHSAQRNYFERLQAGLDVDFDIGIVSRIYQLFGQALGAPERIQSSAALEMELRMIIGALAQLGYLQQLQEDRFRLQLSLEQGDFRLSDQPLPGF
jgi:uncharacterized protein YdgA (DUF945 family)